MGLWAKSAACSVSSDTNPVFPIKRNRSDAPQRRRIVRRHALDREPECVAEGSSRQRADQPATYGFQLRIRHCANGLLQTADKSQRTQNGTVSPNRAANTLATLARFARRASKDVLLPSQSMNNVPFHLRHRRVLIYDDTRRRAAVITVPDDVGEGAADRSRPGPVGSAHPTWVNFHLPLAERVAGSLSGMLSLIL